MENPTTQQEQLNTTVKYKDLHQHVTDLIIRQIEKGILPWNKHLTSDGSQPHYGIPENFATGKKYHSINILLLWNSAIEHRFTCGEWASFQQWQSKKEFIRKGEKGTTIVNYDTFEKTVDGKVKKIPFLKASVVFNRCQLASFKPREKQIDCDDYSYVDNLMEIDYFIRYTGAEIIETGYQAYYDPDEDAIYIPETKRFAATPTCSAIEAYFKTLCHEVIHWSGSPDKLNRTKGEKFGDENYVFEELVAELGAAFLCSEFNIARPPYRNRAGYIADWLQAMKQDKLYILTAASEASLAVAYLHELQP